MRPRPPRVGEGIDLVYLDPPFNSNATYNVLFREKTGEKSAAQITAFEDTWQWGDEAEAIYHELVTEGPRKLGELMQTLRALLGTNGWGPVHDTIFFYTKSERFTWNPVFQPLPQETADAWYNNIEERTGRRFNRADLTAPGVRSGPSGAPWRGINPSEKGRHWAIPGFVKEILKGLDATAALDALDRAGRLHWPKREGGMPMLKRYLEEAKGVPALDVITDIAPLNNVAAERLGYPTQKPEALLERIINASSNEGDVVLDPFCGCGTAVAVAERLHRRWIGIDITHLAIDLMKHRLYDAFRLHISPGRAGLLLGRSLGEPL